MVSVATDDRRPLALQWPWARMMLMVVAGFTSFFVTLSSLPAHELARRESSRSLLSYLDHVVIDSTPPRRWSLIREPWQTDLVRPLTPAIAHASSDGPSSRT